MRSVKPRGSCLEPQTFVREERRQLVERRTTPRDLRVESVDVLDAQQRVVLLRVLRRTDQSGHLVAATQAEAADLRHRDVHVLFGRQVALRAQEAVAVRKDVEHALAVEEPFVLRAPRQDRVDHLRLRQLLGLVDLHLLGELHQVAEVHLLELDCAAARRSTVTSISPSSSSSFGSRGRRVSDAARRRRRGAVPVHGRVRDEEAHRVHSCYAEILLRLLPVSRGIARDRDRSAGA